jgi:hypothetical protein
MPAAGPADNGVVSSSTPASGSSVGRRAPRLLLLVLCLALSAAGLMVAPGSASAADDAGRIDARWAATGGEAGPLGAPLGDPYDVADGRTRDFAGGSVFWSPATDAWEVLGAARDKYAATGGPTGALGFPAGPPQAAVNDPAASEQVFVGGRLYASPTTPPAVLTGPVLERYLSIGGTGSYLGIPTSDLVPVSGGSRASFVRGLIKVDAATGATQVTGQWVAPTAALVAAEQLPYTYRLGCPVGPERLRWLRVPYYDWYGVPQTGDLVVRSGVVPAISEVFRRAFVARFPIRSMRTADVFLGDDIASMVADNTSAFNCRKVTGNPYRLSRHSYGDAIDINTVENPYVTRKRVYPKAGRAFLDRWPARKGMIMPKGPVNRAMTAQGWLWGARWTHPDYPHYSANGR